MRNSRHMLMGHKTFVNFFYGPQNTILPNFLPLIQMVKIKYRIKVSDKIVLLMATSKHFYST